VGITCRDHSWGSPVAIAAGDRCKRSPLPIALSGVLGLSQGRSKEVLKGKDREGKGRSDEAAKEQARSHFRAELR
jgi:hypothetical protein